MGHRNPQGLAKIPNDNKLISTEHGPKGGDEVNFINLNYTKIPNYGWPISSYGDYYGYESFEEREKAPLNKSHKDYGFIEPIVTFTPSIGISQIIKDHFQNENNNDYIVSSLKAKTLFFIEFSKDLMSYKITDELILGERIRDIIFYDNRYYIYLENSPMLGIIEVSN